MPAQPLLSPSRAQGSGALGRLAEHIPEPAAQGPIPATELVTAAVFSMGSEDGTRCWCCGLEPSRCAAGGRPAWGRHRPHSPCGHLQGQRPDSALSWGGRDHMDGQILGQLRPLAEEEEEYGAGDTPSARPAFPGMGSEELRLASFCDWPLSAVVPPELLAAAGFFHTGESQGPGCHCRSFWTGLYLLHGVCPRDREGPHSPSMPAPRPAVSPVLPTYTRTWGGARPARNIWTLGWGDSDGTGEPGGGEGGMRAPAGPPGVQRQALGGLVVGCACSSP